MLLATAASLAAYEPPGLLKGLVEAKFREVEQLRKLPDARDDGPWGLRLGYPAQSASYALTRALSADPGGLALVADLKRVGIAAAFANATLPNSPSRLNGCAGHPNATEALRMVDAIAAAFEDLTGWHGS